MKVHNPLAVGGKIAKVRAEFGGRERRAEP